VVRLPGRASTAPTPTPRTPDRGAAGGVLRRLLDRGRQPEPELQALGRLAEHLDRRAGPAPARARALLALGRGVLGVVVVLCGRRRGRAVGLVDLATAARALHTGVAGGV